MTFIQSCFIRKNTLELKKYLNNLGYEKYPFHTLKDSDYLYANSFDIEYFNGKSTVKGFIPNYFTIDKTDIEDGFDYGVDCGTNEELFKAIAALNNLTDYMQWFIFDGNWVLCTESNFENFSGLGSYASDTYYKATLEELIKHFKNI